MEIERRWLVTGWPDLEPVSTLSMEQGYFATRPAIRIRQEHVLGGSTAGRLHTERATTTNNNRLNLLILRKPLPYRVWVFTISRASSGISVVMKSIPISAISWISSGSFTVHTFVVKPKALHFSTHSGCSRNTL